LKKISITLLLLLAMQLLQAQETRSPLSVRYTETGLYSKNFTDAFSGSINQAALAETKHTTAGMYAERRFMLKELSNYAAAIALPSKFGGFGLALHYFGGENFNTSQFGLGYGKKLNDKIDVGIQFNYNTIKLSGYGSCAAVNFEAGTLLHLTGKLHFGIHAYNPLGSKFGNTGTEKLAAVYSTGIGYEISAKVFISAALRKQEDEPVNINTAFQYGFADHFFVRLGTGTATAYYFFGLGIQWKTLRLDAVSTWQTPLGFTPAIMFLFDFHEDKQVSPIEQ
jgi:hypothetical protein